MKPGTHHLKRPARALLAAAIAGLILTAPARATADDKDAAQAQAERVRQLVGQLSSDSYRQREQAQKDLVEMGAPAIAALEKAAESNDPEVRRRAAEALTEIRKSAHQRASEAIVKGLLWKVELPALKHPPVVVGGVVIVVTGEKVLALDRATGEQVWTFATTWEIGPVAWGPTVYVGDRADNLCALDVKTGKARGGFESLGVFGAPAVADGVIYVGGFQNALWAVDAETGKRKWEAELKAPVVYSLRPLIVGQTLYVATRDGCVHAFDARTGKPKWSGEAVEGRAEPPADERSKARDAGEQVHALLACGDLILACSRGGVRALESATGKAAWNYKQPVEQPAALGANVRIVFNGKFAIVDPQYAHYPPVAGEGAIYVSDGAAIRALDAGTGKEQWAWTPEAKAPVVPDGGVVVIGGGKAQIRAAVVRVQVNNQVMVLNDFARPMVGLSSPAVADGVVYVGSAEGVHAVDARTGQELWRYATSGPVAVAPAIADGVLYLVGSPASSGAVRVIADGQANTTPVPAVTLHALRLKAKD
jgi:outer membrane protein assembly factor BamB